MWVPKTTAELEAALLSNDLPAESSYYEYKRELPPSGKNTDIAIDVAAMTTDGGVIIYGVGEDKTNNTFYGKPIDLRSAVERLSQVVEMYVKVRPHFEAHPLTIPQNQAHGYLVVEVPASPMAPHMVEVKDEYRCYGRHDGGNRKLTQGDLDRLYERRQHIERDVQQALDEAMALDPIEAEEHRGDLHLVARPVVPQPDLRVRMIGDDDGSALRQSVLDAFNSFRFLNPASPEFSEIVSSSHARKTADGVAIESPPFVPSGQTEANYDYVSRLELLDDGAVRVFKSRVAHIHKRREGTEAWIVRESGVAQFCTYFVKMVGQLLSKANYTGQVDLLLSLTGARAAVSGDYHFNDRAFFATAPLPTVIDDDFRNHVRTTSSEMLNTPTSVAAALESRLARLIRPPGMADPLQLRG
jgi:hypothetical protein